jgi:DNA-binding NtrC family response regulator
MLLQYLNEIGYLNILKLKNGFECLANIDQNPEIIFLDYKMEGFNGLEVLKKIKENKPNIGVVFCTAHEDLGVEIEAMKLGSFDFMFKAYVTTKKITSIIDNMHVKKLYVQELANMSK